LLAESTDGLNWNKSNIVLADRSSVADGLVLPSGRILVYYVTGCIEVGGEEQMANHIKVAISDNNGISWTYKNVEFENIPSGGTLPVDPNVVLLENNDIFMLATIDPDQSGTQKPCSYSAISTDGGFTFTLSDSPVYSVTDTDVLDPENYRFADGNWRLWAGGIPGQNMTGFSDNEALSFEDEGLFCSATNTDNPLECYVAADVMLFDESTFKMYAFGTSPNGQIIRSLTSANGDAWTLDPDIVLSVESEGGVEESDVWAPTVVRTINNNYLMVYETRIPSSASTTFSYIQTLQNDTTIVVGDSIEFIARSYFDDNSIREITYFCQWNSTSSDVALINEFGQLTAINQGQTYVYIEYEENFSDSVLITVNNGTNFPIAKTDDFGVSIYPNPTSDIFYIVPKKDNNRISFEITNYFGQTILSGIISTQTEINIEQFNPGLYYIRVVDEQKYSFMKIIKYNSK